MSFFGAPPKEESCRPDVSHVAAFMEIVTREDFLRERREAGLDDAKDIFGRQTSQSVAAVGPLHIHRKTTLQKGAAEDVAASDALRHRISQERKVNRRMEAEIRKLRRQVENFAALRDVRAPAPSTADSTRRSTSGRGSATTTPGSVHMEPTEAGARGRDTASRGATATPSSAHMKSAEVGNRGRGTASRCSQNEGLSTMELHRVLRQRPLDEETGSQLNALANLEASVTLQQRKQRPASGQLPPTDIRQAFDRSVGGQPSWQQSAGDAHNRTVGQAKRESRRPKDIYGRRRDAIVAAKDAEASRHRSAWSTGEVRYWLQRKEAESRMQNRSEKLGALVGNTSHPNLGPRYRGRNRPSVALTEREIGRH